MVRIWPSTVSAAPQGQPPGQSPAPPQGLVQTLPLSFLMQSRSAQAAGPKEQSEPGSPPPAGTPTLTSSGGAPVSSTAWACLQTNCPAAPEEESQSASALQPAV